MTTRAADFDILDANIRVFCPRNIRRLDWVTALLTVLLACTGFLVLYSASRSTASDYWLRQMAYFGVGSVLALAVLCIDHRYLVSLAPLFYVAATTLLLLVLVLGKEVKGGQRWIALGPFHLQPSEQTKLVIVYTLAWYFTLVGKRIRRLPYFVLTFAIVGVPGILILKQPNLGTAACLGPLTLVMVYVAGCRWLHLGIVLLIGAAAIPFAAVQIEDFDPNLSREEVKALDDARPHYELKYYQKQRIYTFLHPESDPRIMGWQSYQSKVTVGSGGLTGKGFCQGTQTYLRYVPEHHNDFVFSLIAEEHGFVGAVCVMAMFLLLLLRGLFFARTCSDHSGTLLAAGAVAILAFHVVVNIGITIGLLPVTGIPLPFLSYGGSFYLTTMLCIGVLLNVPVRSRLFI